MVCVRELLQSRVLYDFYDDERREVQCTERFCIYLKVRGPVHSLNTDSIYFSILQTVFFFIEICYILILKHVLGFLDLFLFCLFICLFVFGLSHIKPKKSNQKIAICVWEKKWRVLLLHFQNKVLYNTRFQYFPVIFPLNYSDKMVRHALYPSGQIRSCLILLTFETRRAVSG